MDYAFLHGGAQGGWVWAQTIAALERQTDGARGTLGRALALDVPGCGEKRGRDTSGIGVEDIVAELIRDIEDAGLENVILVGHSQGGTIIPGMASRRPDLFRRLVYLSCSIPLPGQTILDMMGTGVQGSNPDEVGWRSEARAADMRARSHMLFCNDMDTREATVFLARLGDDMWPMGSYEARSWPTAPAPVPSTYIMCLRDRILPPEWQETFAARFHSDDHVSIDAGHQAMTSRPHALAEILRHEAVRPGPV